MSLVSTNFRGHLEQIGQIPKLMFTNDCHLSDLAVAAAISSCHMHSIGMPILLSVHVKTWTCVVCILGKTVNIPFVECKVSLNRKVERCRYLIFQMTLAYFFLISLSIKTILIIDIT